MSRVNETEVKQIMGIDASIDTADNQAMIDVASLLVTDVIVDTTVSEERKKNVELYLSAHFIALRDQRVASEKADVVAQSFQFRVGLNLNVTIYGQQVMILDTSGAFSQLQENAGKGASPFVFDNVGPAL